MINMDKDMFELSEKIFNDKEIGHYFVLRFLFREIYSNYPVDEFLTTGDKSLLPKEEEVDIFNKRLIKYEESFKKKFRKVQHSVLYDLLVKRLAEYRPRKISVQNETNNRY